MVGYALGLVETRGLVAAIEAADTMVKTAHVILIGKEITQGALVTIKVVGDTAAVHSAVDAGAAAARRIGELVSQHIIPRPDDDLEQLIYSASPLAHEDIERILHGKSITVGKGETAAPREESVMRQEEHAREGSEGESTQEAVQEESKEEPVQDESYVMPEGLTPELQEYFKKLNELTVHELRRLARTIEGLSIYGRQISRANKKELMDELLKVKTQ